MGEVWLSRDTGVTQREVAIKVVRSEGNPRFPEVLASEARVMARVPHHPNKVVLLDVIESTEDLALVIEYVPGRSLRDLLDANPQGFPAEWIKIVATGLLEGMAHAHSHSATTGT
jgi:serine/threonine-protein kinase